MIWCVAGLLGGGKSFYCVDRIARHIARGGICYTNIRLELDPWYNSSYPGQPFALSELYPGALRVLDDTGHGDYYHDANGYRYNARGFRHLLLQRHSWRLQDGQYFYLDDELVGPDLPRHISGGSTDLPSLVVLDEALDHFESGTSSADASFRSFLRHVRKLGIDLIFIAQDFGSLDRRIRALCHYVVNCRDLYTWRMPLFGTPLPPPWRYNIQALEWHTQEFGKLRSPPVNPRKLIYRDPLVFGSYNSTGLHRAFPLRQVQSDFRGRGSLSEDDTMTRILSYISLVISVTALVISLVRSPRPLVSDPSESASAPSIVESPPLPITTNAPRRWVASMSNPVDGGYDLWDDTGVRVWTNALPDDLM